MVYDSDFYTTRRPYRSSPAYSSYTTSFEPSRQVRILPGLGKVHVVHSYDRIVPYVGHKRLTVVTTPPKVFSTRPSVLQREYDWIERKVRPSVGYSATNRYLNSDSAVRIYYSSYPISSSYYTTLSLPSSSYYPKLYRWYYDWARTYTSYLPDSYSYWPRSYYSSYYSPSSYFYWPYYRSYLSSYFRNYYLSHLPSLYYKSLDYEFSDLENKIDNLSKMIYINYPYRTLDYYPESTRIYRPLTLYYNYYYPVRSLNYYSDVWPYYPYYRYLYYKYTLPSDRYYHLKGRIIYLPSPITGSTYRIYPTASYVRHRIYKPLSLYCDYYEPIRALYWNSSYWPLYRSASSFRDELPSRAGSKLQKIFDSETSLIRAQTSALLRRIHDPVPRVQRLSWPLSTVSRHYDDPIPARYSSDAYINKILVSSPYNSKVSYTTYSTEPIRKYIGGRAYDRRPHIYLYENPLQSDIQLLSYYINKFKQEKTYSSDSTKLALSPARPTRKFGAKGNTEADAKQDEEMQKLREARAARLAFINEEEKHKGSKEVDEAVRVKKEKEEAARLAEERALAEEQARQEALAKEAAKKAEIARKEELAAKAAAEKAAELERQAELARQAEAEKQAELERRRQEEEKEKARLEEQKRLEAEKAEEALQAQLRLEEIARKAEEEREAELARQAEELAELARQEAELAEQAKKEAEAEENRRQEAELEELKRQEEELAELERQEQELAEAARQEAELAEKAKEDAEAARREAEEAELAKQEAELEELERAQAELDALEEEAKAMESDLGPSKEEPIEPEVDEAELARQAEEEELRRQDEEIAELERAQAELDALEAEAKAMEDDLGPSVIDPQDEDEDDQAIAEDVPGEQSDEE
ncbi:uncharacterized protein CG45076-like isoform X3 [Anthonomus grandis grandis]|uniref:uncharacterized protein CG45076-like isoform X3 n=1 Tax=Anthonomus grandis grandis TaxID=2921223 RepID=UPI002165FD0A|nr:uncharacterized protein CG45076-like isoform X3 [Anthonomus grandis grandis]